MEFVNGLTVRELKELIKDWPDFYAYGGEPCEVWIGNEAGTSSVVKCVLPLNKREDGSDILFDIE